MRWLTVFGLLLAGCSSCDRSGPAVPFGLEGASASGDRPTPEGPDDPDEGSDPGTLQTFDEGTARVDVDGAALEDERGALRAVYSRDFDGDGDVDAIALRDAPPRLAFHRRDADGFADGASLGSVAAAPGCSITEATIEPLGASWLHAQATITCPAEDDADAGGPERVDHWVLGTDRTPRTLEQLAWLSSRERAPGAVSLALSADDRDEDERTDLVARISVGEGDGATEVALTWFDRPSGLAREGGEPAATLVERSRDALRRLRRQPEQAIARSRRVLALHAALCRAPGRARIEVGGVAGLPCGESDGAGRAAATIVRGHAALDQTAEALEALALTRQPGVRMTDERTRYVRAALEDLPATGELTSREGPAITTSFVEGVRLPAVGFLDEDRVVLRTATPSIWNVATGEIVPGGDHGRQVRDPSGRLVVAAVERTCEGHVLRIHRNGIPTSSPAVDDAPPPVGADCPLRGPTSRDDGGWQVLGWAPQGVVLHRAGSLRVVPLDVEGRPAGSPTDLDPGTPPPVPLPAGAIDPRGTYLASLNGPGVFVRQVGSSEPPTLLWPEGWGGIDGVVTDVAVSPSGRRVAVVRGGRVYLIERGDEAT